MPRVLALRVSLFELIPKQPSDIDSKSHMDRYYDVLTADDGVLISDFGSAGGMESEEEMDSDRNIYTESGINYMETESDVDKGAKQPRRLSRM